MDASASTKQVYSCFIKIDDMKYTKPIYHNNVRKYTKLPDFDFDSVGEAVSIVFIRCFL